MFSVEKENIHFEVGTLKKKYFSSPERKNKAIFGPRGLRSKKKALFPASIRPYTFNEEGPLPVAYPACFLAGNKTKSVPQQWGGKSSKWKCTNQLNY